MPTINFRGKQYTDQDVLDAMDRLIAIEGRRSRDGRPTPSNMAETNIRQKKFSG